MTPVPGVAGFRSTTPASCRPFTACGMVPVSVSGTLIMLFFAASMDGQGAVAIQAGKDYAKSTGDTMYHVLTLVRFGRFDERPEGPAQPPLPSPASARPSSARASSMRSAT